MFGFESRIENCEKYFCRAWLQTDNNTLFQKCFLNNYYFFPSVDQHFKTTEFSPLIKTCRNSVTCTPRWKVTCSPTVN